MSHTCCHFVSFTQILFDCLSFGRRLNNHEMLLSSIYSYRIRFLSCFFGTFVGSTWFFDGQRCCFGYSFFRWRTFFSLCWHREQHKKQRVLSCIEISRQIAMVFVMSRYILFGNTRSITRYWQTFSVLFSSIYEQKESVSLVVIRFRKFNHSYKLSFVFRSMDCYRLRTFRFLVQRYLCHSYRASLF